MKPEATTSQDGGALREPRRICFITTEFRGLFRNGGIGTANTGLALSLAQAGFDVTVAYANSEITGPRVNPQEFDRLKRVYAHQGVRLDFVACDPEVPRAFDDPRSASYSVYLYVRDRAFDVVLFNDNGGQGFHTILAGRAGLLPHPTDLIVVAHGPYDWVHESNADEYSGRSPLIVSFMEQRSAELADLLISPSLYLLQWMRQRGWRVSPEARVLQNVVFPEPTSQRRPPRRGPFKEIVFFGRQEIRKGVKLFCDAMDGLQEQVALQDVTITILGKFSRMGGVHSGVYLTERARAWDAQLRILTALDQREALEYLQRPGVLAVIPSLTENSPCVVVECLELGLPFIATNSGGTAELVAAEDQPNRLCPPDPSELARRLAAALRQDLSPASLAVSQAEIRRQWTALLSQPIRKPRPARRPAAAKSPLVSICLSEPAPPQWFVNALSQQTYSALEVVAPALEEHEIALLRKPGPAQVRRAATAPTRRAAARNAAARQARGDYLLFVDESRVQMQPSSVAALVEAAQRLGSDIVTCMPAAPDGWPQAAKFAAIPAFPTGGGLDIGAIENCFGAGMILTSRKAFNSGLEFPPEADDETMDWAFLLKAFAAGKRLDVVPLRLFRLRADNGVAGLSDVVRGRRLLLTLLADQPAAKISRALELTMDLRGYRNHQMLEAIANLGSQARELATKLSTAPLSDGDEKQAFFDYCCATRQADLAVDYATYNNVSQLADAVAKAGAMSFLEARSPIGRYIATFPTTIDLTESLRAVLRPIFPLERRHLSCDPETLALHPVGPGVVALAAPAGCPTGVRRIVAKVALTAEPGTVAKFGLALIGPNGSLDPSDDGAVRVSAGTWSGWTRADADQDVEICCELDAPSEETCDLYLLSLCEPGGAPSQAQARWISVQAILGATGTALRSREREPLKYARLSADVYLTARVLTDTSSFPFPVLKHGPSFMTHPIADGPLLVLLPNALPKGAAAIRAEVSLEHANALPCDFGFWIADVADNAASEAELSRASLFSGWFTVRTALSPRPFSVQFERATDRIMNLILAVRRSEGRVVDCCHAHWRDIMVARVRSDNAL